MNYRKLNPIFCFITAEEKIYVARHNTTFKIKDVEKLFHEAKAKITKEKWQKAVNFVITNVENKFWELDGMQEEEIAPFIIELWDESGDEGEEGGYESDMSGDNDNSLEMDESEDF